MLRFTKMHGLGNDFVVIDGCTQAVPEEERWPAMARQLAERHFGIGADGLVFILPHKGGGVQMRMLNPDGSEAEMCGNAIRCVAKYTYEHLGLREETLPIATITGLKEVRLEVLHGCVRAVTVNMGKPVLQAADIPVAAPVSPVVNWPLEAAGAEFAATCVSMGNPHCVIFVPRVNEVPLEHWGPAIERHPAFPQRTNVEFVEVLAPDRLQVRVWERGAGVTLACGTGACAVAVAGVLTGRSQSPVRISLPGGDLLVSWEGWDEVVWMEGPAVEVFRGELEDAGEMVWA